MKRNEIIIRTAVIEDLNTLELFEQAVIKYERPFASNLKDDPINYYNIKNLIQQENADLLVATVDDKIVASGYALIKNSIPYKNPSQYAYLGFMFVLPAYRKKGINRLIIGRLIEMVKKRNITEVQLDVYANNEIALNAYKKIGFKPDLLKMRLNLEE